MMCAHVREMCDALDEILSVLERFLDLVHTGLNVNVDQLLEPTEHLGLHLGAVSRRHLSINQHCRQSLKVRDNVRNRKPR